MPIFLEGTRPLTGPALPNLINAASMLKVKVKVKVKSALANAEINKLVLTLTF